MDEEAIQTEKSKRTKGRAFWLLLLFQMPVLLMWLVGYNGYMFPFWVALTWLLICYARSKTTSYIVRVGVHGVIDRANSEIMVYQERPWYFLLPIPLFIGIIAVLRAASDPGANQWMVVASGGCGILFVLTCPFEAVRKWRF